MSREKCSDCNGSGMSQEFPLSMDCAYCFGSGYAPEEAPSRRIPFELEDGTIELEIPYCPCGRAIYIPGVCTCGRRRVIRDGRWFLTPSDPSRS